MDCKLWRRTVLLAFHRTFLLILRLPLLGGPRSPKTRTLTKIMIVKWLLWDQMDCKRRRWTI
eukprot:8049287-Pyramimonas_sp.AAC.1